MTVFSTVRCVWNREHILYSVFGCPLVYNVTNYCEDGMGFLAYLVSIVTSLCYMGVGWRSVKYGKMSGVYPHLVDFVPAVKMC